MALTSSISKFVAILKVKIGNWIVEKALSSKESNEAVNFEEKRQKIALWHVWIQQYKPQMHRKIASLNKIENVFQQAGGIGEPIKPPITFH